MNGRGGIYEGPDGSKLHGDGREVKAMSQTDKERVIAEMVRVERNDKEGLSSTLYVDFPVEPWMDEYGSHDDCEAAAEDWRKRLKSIYDAGYIAAKEDAARNR